MNVRRTDSTDPKPIATAADHVGASVVAVEKRARNLVVRSFNGIIGFLLNIIRGLLATIIGGVGKLIGGLGATISSLTGGVRTALVGTAKVVSPLSHGAANSIADASAADRDSAAKPKARKKAAQKAKKRDKKAEKAAA